MEASQPNPTHDLDEVKKRVRVGFVHYRKEALDTAAELDFTFHDIAECILELGPDDFHKTMPALNPAWVGCVQDVYKPTFRGVELYVKLQLWPSQRVYVVSFKKKEQAR